MEKIFNLLKKGGNMNRFLKSLMVILTIGALAGCAENGGSGITKQQVGTVAGGVVGGVLGNEVFDGNAAGIIGGTLVGAVLGGAVGKSMDDTDRLKMQQALVNTPQGSQASWENNKTGADYTVTPVQDFKNQNNLACRRAKTTVQMDGKTQTAYTTICQQQNGKWYVQN